MKKRIVSLFMALVMTLSLLPTTAWAVQPSPAITEQTLTEQTAEEPSAAEETTPAEVQPAAESADTALTDDNSFLLFAATNVEVLIAPERVPYQPNQTVREALLALQNREETPHTFTGLETSDGFVTAIDGVSAGYLRSDDKGSFDLEQRADSVGAFLFLTAYDTLNEETASALCALGRAMLAWQEAEKPQMQKFARQEYDAAAKALTVKKTADELTALSTALTERMEAYTQYENAETKPLNVRFLGLTGQLLTDCTFTAADPYGNEKTFTNEHPALAAGSYLHPDLRPERRVRCHDGGGGRQRDRGGRDADDPARSSGRGVDGSAGAAVSQRRRRGGKPLPNGTGRNGGAGARRGGYHRRAVPVRCARR